MIVCHCRRVSDGAIRAAIVGGARTVDEVGEACAAGTGCGGCLPAIERLLDAAGAPAELSLPCGGACRAYVRPLEPLATLRAVAVSPAEDT